MDWSMYVLIQKPVYQTLLFLVFTPVIIFILQPKSADMAWQIAAYTFALFLIVNAVLLWFDASPWRYFFYSIGFAVGYLLIIAMMMRGLLSVLKLQGSEEGGMAFLIILYQPFVLLFVMLAKWIVLKWF